MKRRHLYLPGVLAQLVDVVFPVARHVVLEVAVEAVLHHYLGESSAIPPLGWSLVWRTNGFGEMSIAPIGNVILCLGQFR